MNWYENRAREKKRELDSLYKTAKMLSWVAILALLLGLSSCKTSAVLSTPYKEEHPVSATLELAYEYQKGCGKHKTCSAWMGRFKEDATGQMWNRTIEGWSYRRFVDNGRKPEPGWTLSLSQEDRGNKTPFWVDLLFYLGFILTCAAPSLLFGVWLNYGMERDLFYYLYAGDLK